MAAKNILQKSILVIAVMLISLSFISAITVEKVEADKILPGQAGKVTITVKNTLNDSIEDVSLILNLDETRFTTVGSSEDSENEIGEDDKESFSFVIKAPNDLKPGDYNIPYTIRYKIGGEEKEKNGSFGLSVGAKTEVDFSVEAKDAIINEHYRRIIRNNIKAGLFFNI